MALNFRQLKLDIHSHIPELSPITIGVQVNLVYQRLLRMYKWNFLKTHDFFTTNAPYATGTCTVANGATTFVGAGGADFTTGTPIAVGDNVRVGTDKTFYEITTITDATNLVLADNYVGSLGAGETYSIFRNVYNLASDFGEFVSLAHETSIHEVSSTYLNIDDPLRETSGKPTRYTMRGETAAGLKRVEVYPVPDAAYLLYYTYLKTVSDLSADTDTPAIRDDVLLYSALVDCYNLALVRNPDYATLIPYMEGKANATLRSLVAQEVRLEPEEKQRWLESETSIMRHEGGRQIV